MNYGFRDYDDYVDAMNERKKNAEYLLDDSEDDYEDYYLEEIIKDAIEDMRSDK